MMMRRPLGPLIRSSGIPAAQNRPELNNQTFRITRGRRVPGHDGRGGNTVVVPLPTHWRRATCEEIGCRHHLVGWWTRIDLAPTLDADTLMAHQRADYYIRHNCERRYIEAWEGTTIAYHFEAGQDCFKTTCGLCRACKEGKACVNDHHWIPLERDPIFVHQDWKGRVRTGLDYDEFFDTFNENSYQLNRRAQQG